MTTSLNYHVTHYTASVCCHVTQLELSTKTIHTKYYDCVCTFTLITWLSNLIFLKPYSMYLEHQFHFKCLSHTSAR